MTTQTATQLLNTAGASQYLRERYGLRVAPATLSKLRCVGGGPRFKHWGRTPVYEIGDLESWKDTKLRLGGAP